MQNKTFNLKTWGKGSIFYKFMHESNQVYAFFSLINVDLKLI